MKVTGDTTWHQAEASSITLMETSMMVCEVTNSEFILQVTGKMIRPTAMEFTTTLTAPNTKVNGKMISNMEKDMNHGLMAASSTVFMLNQRKKAVACIHGLTVTSTLETGLTI